MSMDRLNKLLAMAKLGEGAERESAQRLLERELAKAGLTLADLEKPAERTTHWFTHKRGGAERKLLNQLAYAVLGGSYSGIWTHTAGPGRHTLTGVDCTDAEAVEIKFLFDVHRVALEKAMERAVSAYIMANRIFPADAEETPPRPTREDYQAMLMARGITPTQVIGPSRHLGGAA